MSYYYSDGDVGERSWGEDELVESTEEGSHEGVGLGDIDFTSVVNVELSPGSWEEFGHVGFHLGLRDLLGDEEDLGSGFLAGILIEDLGSGGLTSSVGGLDGIMVEDVVHNIVLIGTVVSRGWGISSGWWWWGFFCDGDSFNGGSEEGCYYDHVSKFHCL